MELSRQVVLASASPRREALLREIVSTFEVMPANVDERALPGESPVDTAIRLAREKASCVAKVRPAAIVVAGDTVVEIDGVSVDKPRDSADAAEMLRLLSGRQHRVTTAVALTIDGAIDVFATTTRVRFRNLTTDEIEDYARTREPLDKAGAYAIQGGAAGFVEAINGSLSNVVGLPIEELAERIARLDRGANTA